ncbi:Rpn family recombination-promoting nuclease/putative transposase [Anabaena azotica FACHB-119]|uniref:Rpn family recombination-promoting nuclease/putative transposase n=2 Tax=Anabaena azotica TaxID=197653 RepID=A0ABR8DBS3_9NOST|nr:Rpn family recombination-promoting nuclease/putative transposase [Anabaena azotica FACHB-119]
MLGMSLEETRVYREAKAEAWKEAWKQGWKEGWKQGWKEGREERKAEMLKVIVPLLLKTGMNIEQIAQQLNVDLESVRFATQQN